MKGRSMHSAPSYGQVWHLNTAYDSELCLPLNFMRELTDCEEHWSRHTENSAHGSEGHVFRFRPPHHHAQGLPAQLLL